MKTLFKLMVMLAAALAVDTAKAEKPLLSSSAASVRGHYNLRVEVRRQDSVRQVFDLTINNRHTGQNETVCWR